VPADVVAGSLFQRRQTCSKQELLSLYHVDAMQHYAAKIIYRVITSFVESTPRVYKTECQRVMLEVDADEIRAAPTRRRRRERNTFIFERCNTLNMTAATFRVADTRQHVDMRKQDKMPPIILPAFITMTKDIALCATTRHAPLSDEKMMSMTF